MNQLSAEDKVRAFDELKEAISAQSDERIYENLIRLGYSSKGLQQDDQVPPPPPPTPAPPAQPNGQQLVDPNQIDQRQLTPQQKAWMQANMPTHGSRNVYDDVLGRMAHELKTLKDQLSVQKQEADKKIQLLKEATVTDKHESHVQAYIKENFDKFPALKGHDKSNLATLVIEHQIEASQEKDAKIPSPEQILTELNDDNARRINLYIEDKEKQLKLLQPEEDEVEYYTDSHGNKVEVLKGDKVKTLTDDMSQGDNIKSPKEVKKDDTPKVDHDKNATGDVYEDSIPDADKIIRATIDGYDNETAGDLNSDGIHEVLKDVEVREAEEAKKSA